MTMQVSSIAELEQLMISETQKAMDASSNDLIEEIKQSIDEVVYSYSPVRYGRTHALRESLESHSGGGGGDASLLVNHNTGNAGWFSVKDGSGISTIPEIVTYGGYGTFVGWGEYAHGNAWHNINPSGAWAGARDYMQHAEDKLDGGGYLHRCLSPYLPPYARIV